MALRNKATGHYLKVTGVSAATETGVMVTIPEGDHPVNRVTTSVSFAVFRSAEDRQAWPHDQFIHPLTYTVGFEKAPVIPEAEDEYNRMIAAGYLLLKTLPENKDWEDD